MTYSTSAVLDLNPGTWYYRVRGLNQTQLKKQEMILVGPDQAHGLEAELPRREQLASRR